MSETRKPKLVDPYANLPMSKKTVTSLTIGDEDRAVIYAICPQHSVLQTTVNRLFSEFVKTLKKAGYKSYNPDEYVKAVNSVRITLDKHEKKEKELVV
jgi:hypothetical protein